MELDDKIPPGPIEEKWSSHLEHIRLIGPRNRPKYTIIVVGTGLAGASAAASVAAMGYRVAEVPISYIGRTRSEGKKIGLKDGLEALYCIARHWKRSEHNKKRVPISTPISRV